MIAITRFAILAVEFAAVQVKKEIQHITIGPLRNTMAAAS